MIKAEVVVARAWNDQEAFGVPTGTSCSPLSRHHPCHEFFRPVEPPSVATCVFQRRAFDDVTARVSVAIVSDNLLLPFFSVIIKSPLQPLLFRCLPPRRVTLFMLHEGSSVQLFQVPAVCICYFHGVVFRCLFDWKSHHHHREVVAATTRVAVCACVLLIMCAFVYYRVIHCNGSNIIIEISNHHRRVMAAATGRRVGWRCACLLSLIRLG